MCVHICAYVSLKLRATLCVLACVCKEAREGVVPMECFHPLVVDASVRKIEEG